MKLLQSTTELRAWRSTLPSAATVGFVPTMGALHEGHVALLQEARAHNDIVVLSIFVNPKQFGAHEDLAKYPRPWEADLALARGAGIDAGFLPTPEDFYPDGFSTTVEESALSQPWCGATRPGHFRGVTTVVLKLLNLIQPTRAYFGWKDAQQFLVLSKMVRDLSLPVEMVGVPTVREPDGLALSSRNRFLSPEQRELAPLLYREISKAAERMAAGQPWQEACALARATLNEAGFQVQYLEPRRECAGACDLALPPGNILERGVPHRLAIAAVLGSTRLIDNIPVISGS